MRLNVLIAVFAGVGAPAVSAFFVPTSNNAPLLSLNMAESNSVSLSRGEKMRQQIQQEISDVEAEPERIQKQITNAETQRETIPAEVAVKLKKLESVQFRGGAGAINLGIGPIFLAGGVSAIAAGRAALTQREKVRLEEEITRAEAQRSALETQQAQASSAGLFGGIAAVGLLFANLVGIGAPFSTSSVPSDTVSSSSSVVVSRKTSSDSSFVTPTFKKSEKPAIKVKTRAEKYLKPVPQNQTAIMDPEALYNVLLKKIGEPTEKPVAKTIDKPDSTDAPVAPVAPLLQKVNAPTEQSDTNIAEKLDSFEGSVVTLLQKVMEPTEKPETSIVEEPVPPKAVDKAVETPERLDSSEGSDTTFLQKVIEPTDKPVIKTVEEPVTPKRVVKVVENLEQQPDSSEGSITSLLQKVMDPAEKPGAKILEESVTPKAVVKAVETPSKSEASVMNVPTPALTAVGIGLAAGLAAFPWSKGGQGSVSEESESKKATAASISAPSASSAVTPATDGDYQSALGGGAPVKKTLTDGFKVATTAVPMTTSTPAPAAWTVDTQVSPNVPKRAKLEVILGLKTELELARKFFTENKVKPSPIPDLELTREFFAENGIKPLPSPVESQVSPTVSKKTTSELIEGIKTEMELSSEFFSRNEVKAAPLLDLEISRELFAQNGIKPVPGAVPPGSDSSASVSKDLGVDASPSTSSAPTLPVGGDYLSGLGGDAPVKKAPARGKPKVATKTMGGYLDRI